MRATRPGVFSSRRSRWPDTVSCELEPVGEIFGTDSVLSEDRITAHIRVGVEQAKAKLFSEGRRVLGAAGILGTRRDRRSSHPVGVLNPRFATLDPELMRDAIASDGAFHEAHERAKARFLEGETSAVFPAGTYGYRMMFGVQVAGMAA